MKWDGKALDGLVESLTEQVSLMSEDAVAEKLATRARQMGLDSVDSVNLDITINGDPGGLLKFDESRIRARANEILAMDGHEITSTDASGADSTPAEP